MHGEYASLSDFASFSTAINILADPGLWVKGGIYDTIGAVRDGHANAKPPRSVELVARGTVARRGACTRPCTACVRAYALSCILYRHWLINTYRCDDRSCT